MDPAHDSEDIFVVKIDKIPGKSHFQLKNDAQPFAHSTPRRVALK